MASVSDIENRTSISEETPLLDDQQAGKPPDQAVRENGNAGWYVWRIFWVIFAIILLVVFIRSWIDAGGEIDVGAWSDLCDLSPPLIISCIV